MDSACNTDFSSHMLLVLCQDYFSHTEGKKSLVNCLFDFCSVRFKNWWCNVFKFVLRDITQSLKLWKSSNETARGRDHLSRSFQTPRNEDAQRCTKHEASVNLRKPWGPSYQHLKAQELHTASFQAQKHTPPINRSSGIPSPVFSGSTWLSLLHSVSTALPCLLWSPSIAVRDVTRRKQSDWRATIVAHGTKIE